MRYLAFDCETGGLDPKEHSLLTLYLAVYDESFAMLDELDLKIKPEADGFYCVTAGAMGVNKINLVSHDREAQPTSEATKRLFLFIKKWSDDSKNKLCPVAHNLPFDEAFITNHLLKKSVWDSFISYHKLDTVGIAQFLKAKGKLPNRTPLRLGDLAKALSISFNHNDLHGSKVDTLLCVEVLKAMLSY